MAIQNPLTLDIFFFFNQHLLHSKYQNYTNIQFVFHSICRTVSIISPTNFLLVQNISKLLLVLNALFDNLLGVVLKCRSYKRSRSQMFFKIVVLKYFTIFTRKHMCWTLFLIKLQAFKLFL